MGDAGWGAAVVGAINSQVGGVRVRIGSSVREPEDWVTRRSSLREWEM
jgi:hypothetical protein